MGFIAPGWGFNSHAEAPGVDRSEIVTTVVSLGAALFTGSPACWRSSCTRKYISTYGI